MEVIKLRNSMKVFKDRGLEDIKDILSSSYLIILILLFSSMYVLHNLPKLAEIIGNVGSNVLLSLVVALFSFVLINSGVLLARKNHTGEAISLKKIVRESIVWVGVFTVFNAVKIAFSLIFFGVVLYLGLLERFLIQPWQIYSFIGVLFTVSTGLLGKSIGYSFMSIDGLVMKKVKGKERLSVSLTKKRVAEYKLLDSKVNFLINIIFNIVGSLLLVLISYSEFFLPIGLILLGVLNYLLYSYSFEKIILEEQKLGSENRLLVMGLKEELEAEEDILDSSIEELQVTKKNFIDRSNGAGGLSKESILGEHWYLSDKPSIIEKEPEEQDEFEEDKII